MLSSCGVAEQTNEETTRLRPKQVVLSPEEAATMGFKRPDRQPGEKIRSLSAYFPLGGLQLVLSVVAIQLLFVLAGASPGAPLDLPWISPRSPLDLA